MGNFQCDDFEFDPQLSSEGVKKATSTIDATTKLESVTSTIDGFMENISPLMRRSAGPGLSKFDMAEVIGLRADIDVSAPLLQKSPEQPKRESQPEPESSHFEPLVKMISKTRSHPSLSEIRKDEELWSRLVMDSLEFVEAALAE